LGSLDGRITIITGAGRGLGRAHALLLASEGARVVVNDISDDRRDNAEAVVEEIRSAGGEAVASREDVTDWEGGRRLVSVAVERFGGLDVLVNNAGIVRDRALVNMTEGEWDEVTDINLKGHFVPTRWAATYWREQAKGGSPRRASLVNTSSTSGLLNNPGQTNYGAAKAGVAAFSSICARELPRYGARTNCIAPAARTRLTEAAPGLAEIIAPPADGSGFDLWDPANVSPLVAYLATAECPLNGRTLFIQGGTIRLMEGWHFTDSIEREHRWTVDELGEALVSLGQEGDGHRDEQPR
jgi:NAD(P)-dependent dehydrogenase (short-subunit alcohol dehydrogenase family)